MNNKKIRKGTKTKKTLVIVNVLGSTGPIRLLVKEDDSVASVVDSALKAYAKEGRLPSLAGSNNHFILYPSNYEASSTHSCQGEAIGRSGARSFVMCKKQLNSATMTEGRSDVNNNIMEKKSSRSLMAWINRSFTSFKF
ncbi:hypothetical protein LINPERPRIM_LOCUS2878 [Linum perenne]